MRAEDLYRAGALARKTVRLESRGIDVEIQELTVAARAEIMDLNAAGEQSMIGPVVVKYGTVAMKDEDVDTIANSLSPDMVSELAGHIMTLSGLGDDSGN